MASPNISVNPVEQTNFPNTFAVDSTGFVQGKFVDDPAIRFELRGGVVASTETDPMWGGIAIAESLPAAASSPPGFGSIARASTIGAGAATDITGFTVYNQGTAMVQTPQSRAPLAGVGMAINFFRLGSGARIVVAAAASLVTALEGGAINQEVAWDFTNQQLIAYTSGNALPVKIVDTNAGNSKVVTYSSTTGFANWNDTGSAVEILI